MTEPSAMERIASRNALNQPKTPRTTIAGFETAADIRLLLVNWEGTHCERCLNITSVIPNR
eukprot:CAMPEP_0194365064 /NCGR_PEP_ID=MMETSP0174-20130528/13039_1 /TAXON_ID=216777 /ORGANISM="Proboscia alata, Strain PI-D3" /LENGTH=60 /DNA_ID=CAMNT_0039139493 /DNA_START=181 /DNA_END=363 /DNA_ORIENTATION=+